MEHLGLGKKIRDLRKSRNMRQDDLAEVIGLSRGQVSNIETEKRSISLVQLQKLCKLFKVDLDYFGLTPDAQETISLLERAKLIFESNEISTKEKDELYIQLMDLYLKAKKE